MITLGTTFPGSGPAWLNENGISCPSNANSLRDCTLGPWNISCLSYNDLWLTCSPLTSPICELIKDNHKKLI